MCQTVHPTITIQVKAEVERQTSSFSDPRTKAGSAIALGRLQRRDVRAKRKRWLHRTLIHPWAGGLGGRLREPVNSTLSSVSQLSWVFKGLTSNYQLCYLRIPETTHSEVKKVTLDLIAEVSAHCWLVPLTLALCCAHYLGSM